MFVGELIFKYSERKQVHSNFVKLIFAQIFEFFVRDTIIKSLNELKKPAMRYLQKIYIPDMERKFIIGKCSSLRRY